MAVRLQNLTRRPVTLILDAHGELAERVPCVRQTVVAVDHNPQTGDRAMREVRRRFPAAITLQPRGMAGDVVSDLPDVVVRCAEVARAAREGRIGVAAMAVQPPRQPVAPARSAAEVGQDTDKPPQGTEP